MSQSFRKLATSGVFGAAVLAGACGGGQTRLNLFSTTWEDDRGASIARVWKRIGESPVPTAASIAVGVSLKGDALVGLPLGDGSQTPWTVSHALDSRPVVTGNVVVASGGGEVFAVDAATGQTIWRRPTGGLPLVGAGDDGVVTVATFDKAGGMGSVLLAVKHDGEVIRQIETDKPLGVPAVVARLAFVPWAGQYVSVIDLANGDETARVTLRGETSRAWTEGGSLWFGEIAFTRFDDRIRLASTGEASTATVPARELPGTPKLMPPGATPLPAGANAGDKVHLYARPVATSGGAAVDDARYYATYFRVAMSFDVQSAKIGWVHVRPTDLLGGAAASGGVVLCDEQGTVVTLAANNGGVLAETKLGQPLRACVVNVDGFHPTGSADAKPLVEQLEEAVRIDDPMIVSAQRFLLQDLATAEDPSATKTLIDLASDPRTSPDLVAQARASIAKRSTGEKFMVAALERHYDFLKDVLQEPPVGPIAVALGAMNQRAAAPLLVAHLFDPSDTDDDVKRAAEALLVVAGPNQLPALRRFFGMYRASADSDDVAAAVVSVGETLLASHDPSARAEVQAAADDEMTVPYARDRLTEALAADQGDAGSPNAGTDGGAK